MYFSAEKAVCEMRKSEVGQGWREECLHLDTDTADTHSFRCRIQRILGSRGRGTHLATTLPIPSFEKTVPQSTGCETFTVYRC